MQITQDEVLDALRQALEKKGGEDGVTSAEMAEATGWGRERVRRGFHALAKQGRLEVVQVNRPTLDGRTQQVPAYRVRTA